MKIVVRCLAIMLALLALAAAGFGVYTALRWWRELPVLVQVPPVAQQRVEELFSAVEAGDYPGAEALILGQPSLGADSLPEDSLAALIWDAYQSTLKFEPLGGFYATDTGLAIDYKVTRLDFSSVMGPVAARAEALMAQRIQEAEAVSQVYDANNEYREDFVQQTLHMAVKAALQEDAAYTQVKFTVELIYQDGTWWIQGNKALLSAISADFAG